MCRSRRGQDAESKSVGGNIDRRNIGPYGAFDGQCLAKHQSLYL